MAFQAPFEQSVTFAELPLSHADSAWTSTGQYRISLKLFYTNTCHLPGPNTVRWTVSNGITGYVSIQLLHNNDTISPNIPSPSIKDGLLATVVDVTAGHLVVTPYW